MTTIQPMTMDMQTLPQANSGNAMMQMQSLNSHQIRTMAEIQAQVAAARNLPRDIFSAYTSSMKELEVYELAEKAIYSFPRGKEIVTGPSIRMAEMFMRNYGNMQSGVIEVDRKDDESTCIAFCWDMQSNNREIKEFKVPHYRDTKNGRYKLKDDRDIREMIFNIGQRMKRTCILACLPIHFIEDGKKTVHRTLAAGDKSLTMEQRLMKMLLKFKELSVTQEMLEDLLEHKWSDTSLEEFPKLQGIYNALKDKTAERKDFFDIKKPQTDTAEMLRAEPKDKK